MPVLFRLAIRNLIEHRAKTLIIGILVALGMSILVSGSAVVRSASSGIEKTFIENFTGSIVVTGIADATVSLFGVHANMMSETVPTLPRYEEIADYVQTRPQLTRYAGQITGYAVLNTRDEGKLFTMLFGIDPTSYGAMFDSIAIQEGRYLRDGEEGILLEQGMVADLRDESAPYRIGDPVVLTGFGAAGFRIRELPLVGVYSYVQQTELLERLAFIDAQSLRSLLGMTVGTAAEIEISESDISLLSSSDEDAMFTGIMIDDTPAADPAVPLPSADPAETEVQRNYAAPVWHFMLIHVADGVDAAQEIAEMNSWFASEGIAAHAIDWKKASAGFGVTADVMSGIFIVSIIIVAAVAVIIMMNTLTVSVFERTSEIGTMRALGAHKPFVWKMLFTETLTITLCFGIIGIAIGTALILVLRELGLEATDMITNTLYGGSTFAPEIQIRSILSALGLTGLIALVACLYPVHIALKIPPVSAIASE